MATLQFAENFYSFRATQRTLDAFAIARSPSQASLAAIEAKLVEANNDFLARRYQDAIRAYNAAAGIVRIQAQTMRPATPHFTADKRRVAPTPTIEPVIVCVVETGVPVSVT